MANLFIGNSLTNDLDPDKYPDTDWHGRSFANTKYLYEHPEDSNFGNGRWDTFIASKSYDVIMMQIFRNDPPHSTVGQSTFADDVFFANHLIQFAGQENAKFVLHTGWPLQDQWDSVKALGFNGQETEVTRCNKQYIAALLKRIREDNPGREITSNFVFHHLDGVRDLLAEGLGAGLTFADLWSDNTHLANDHGDWFAHNITQYMIFGPSQNDTGFNLTGFDGRPEIVS